MGEKSPAEESTQIKIIGNPPEIFGSISRNQSIYLQVKKNAKLRSLAHIYEIFRRQICWEKQVKLDLDYFQN